MKKTPIKQIFKRGFIALAPVIICGLIAIWIIKSLETIFAPIITEIIGEKYYFPGLGFIFALFVVFFIGLLINTWVIKKIYKYGEKIIVKIPIVSMVYTSIKDVFKYFDTKNKLGTPVKIKILDNYCIGFVTRKDFDKIFNSSSPNEVSVFIPLSYQIGGITLIVDSSKIEKINLNVEETLRFSFSGGVLAKK